MPRLRSGSAAAGVVAAARARVAGARALHHAAALVAGRAEVQADHADRDDRRRVRQRDGRGLRGREGLRGALAVGWAGRTAGRTRGGVLGGLLGADLLREDAELLLGVGVQ